MLGVIMGVIAGYALGTFPTAALIGRRTGHDPTTEGSLNPGATNVYRTSGRNAGVVVLLVDVAKGALAAGLGWALGGRDVALAAGAAAVVGHVLPVTRGFRGGKGVATAAGMSMVLYPLLSLVLLGVLLVVVAVTRRMSVGSLVLAVLLPMGVAAGGYGWAETLVVSGISVLVIARHRDNIRRLIRREETDLRPTSTPGESTA
jgi:acyl phosphate:glycerol-3-phosphate acyltransferase